MDDPEEFHHIGARLRCVTCLGTEIIGILIAYHIDQKLMLLRLENFIEEEDDSLPGRPESSRLGAGDASPASASLGFAAGQGYSEFGQGYSQTSAQAAQVGGGGSGTVERSLSSEDDCSKHDYTLVNLRFISCLEELKGGMQIDKMLRDDLPSSSTNQTTVNESSTTGNNNNNSQQNNNNTNNNNNNNDNITSPEFSPARDRESDTPVSKKSKKSNRKSAGGGGCDNPVRKKLIEDGLLPPNELDLAKLANKREAAVDNKMRIAKLTKLGVTQDGFDLKQTIEKTMGAQRDTVKWDKSGNIMIFDEVKIGAPFNLEHVSQVKSDANVQTINYVRRIVEKYYKDKEEREGQSGGRVRKEGSFGGVGSVG